MTYTMALCGHSVPAVGSPHSKARQEQESRFCLECESRMAGQEWLTGVDITNMTKDEFKGMGAGNAN